MYSRGSRTITTQVRREIRASLGSPPPPGTPPATASATSSRIVLRLDLPLPGEGPEGIRTVALGARIDRHLQPFEREGAAVDHDTAEVRHVVAGMHEGDRRAVGGQLPGAG